MTPISSTNFDTGTVEGKAQAAQLDHVPDPDSADYDQREGLISKLASGEECLVPDMESLTLHGFGGPCLAVRALVTGNILDSEGRLVTSRNRNEYPTTGELRRYYQLLGSKDPVVRWATLKCVAHSLAGYHGAGSNGYEYARCHDQTPDATATALHTLAQRLTDSYYEPVYPIDPNVNEALCIVALANVFACTLTDSLPAIPMDDAITTFNNPKFAFDYLLTAVNCLCNHGCRSYALAGMYDFVRALQGHCAQEDLADMWNMVRDLMYEQVRDCGGDVESVWPILNRATHFGAKTPKGHVVLDECEIIKRLKIAGVTIHYVGDEGYFPHTALCMLANDHRPFRDEYKAKATKAAISMINLDK